MAIVAVLFLGLVFRLINLGQSLWLDEAVQAVTSQGSFGGIFSELQGDLHPPLYHFLMWIWVRLFGIGEISLRLPSVFFGVATVYVVCLIAKQFFPRNNFTLAELAALLLATAPFHIYYSQEARMYAMTTFFAALSMYYFMRLVKNEESRRSRLPYIFSTTLLLYSDYFGFLILLAQAISVLFINRKRLFSPGSLSRSRLLRGLSAKPEGSSTFSRDFFVIQLFCLLLFIPWLPMFFTQLRHVSRFVQSLPEWGRLINANLIKALPLTFIKFSIGRITIFNKKLYAALAGVLFVIYGAIVAKGAVAKKKYIIHNTPYIILLLWLFIPILSTWLISFFIPNYQPFRLILVLPAFYLLLANGALEFHTTMIRIIVVMLVLTVNLASLGVYYFNPYFHREDWRGVVGHIESRKRPSLAILPSETSNWPWRYYSSGRVKLIPIASGVRKISQEDLEHIKIEQFNNWTIYYIRYLVPLFDPQEKISSWLDEKGFVKIGEVSFNQIPIWEYRGRSELYAHWD